MHISMQVPLKSLLIDGNCRVEDRGLKTHHGQVSIISSNLSPFRTILLLMIYCINQLAFTPDIAPVLLN